MTSSWCAGSRAHACLCSEALLHAATSESALTARHAPAACRVQKMLAVGAVLPACLAAIHPANSAIRLAAEGLRLRGCAFAQQHALVLETLMLRGGGEVVPAVAWSQRQDSLLLKVDIPAGASLDGLAVGSDGNLLEWEDDKVALNLELYGSLDQGSVVKTDAGRQVTLSAKKTAPEWWPKLTKGPKPGNVKIDWASWKDEDEGELSTSVRPQTHIVSCIAVLSNTTADLIAVHALCLL